MPSTHARDETAALAALMACGGAVAPRRALLESAGSAAAALAAGASAWRQAGLDAAQCQALARPEPTQHAATLAWAAEPGHSLVGWLDEDYPPLLREAPAPPLALCVAGDVSTLWRPALAVVGSRGATPAGLELASDFARAFVAAGYAVGSGLAAGIDTAAHAATLAAGGCTFAVLGTGPDLAYPPANRRLQERLAAEGALVSEHLPGTAPRREFFPSRNRILAGLTLGTVVVEAAERSGALITARLAADAGREVFAVPGSVRNPMVRGCHRLIRDGAGLVENASEVLQAVAARTGRWVAELRLRSLPEPAMVAPVQPPSPALDADSQRLWKSLGFDPMDMDQLVERSGLTAATLSSMLLAMELEGRVASQFGRYYRVR